MDWPPAELKHTMPQIDVWGAWYSGVPEDLVRVYSRDQRLLPAIRPAQYRGGVTGALARFWWGQPNMLGTRDKLHMPLAADIASASSDLLFSEELTVTGMTDRLDQVLDFNSWQSLLPESGELCAAFGGVYLCVGWDEGLAKFPIITPLDPEGAWPVFHHGHLAKVTFWSRLPHVIHDDRVRRLLEVHTPGTIHYEVYDGRHGELGQRIHLEGIQGLEDIVAQVDDNGDIPTGIDELTVVYIPNVRPAPMWHSDPTGRYMGRADISGSEAFLDAIDETWTSWMRDIRHGKSRIIAPKAFLESGKAGEPLWFNMEQDLFVAANTGGQLDVPMKDQLSVQQFTIRTAEHEATLKNLIGVVTRRAGYSSSTFDMVDEAAPTATEVNSRDRRSHTTREKKTRYWTPALETLLRVVQKVDAQLFSQAGPDDANPIKVSFPSASQQSPAELAQTVQLLDAARAVSAKTRVQMVHPDWTEPQIDEEVAAILADSPAAGLGLGLV